VACCWRSGYGFVRVLVVLVRVIKLSSCADNATCQAVILCVGVTAPRPPMAAGASGGFGTVGSRGGSGGGPPQLAGLFSGGMPQLRSRGGTPTGAQSDSGSSTTPRPGLYPCH